MAIQLRRGLAADYDASKMLPGEVAICLDTNEMYFMGSASTKLISSEVQVFSIGSSAAVNIKTPSSLSAAVEKSGHTCILRLINGVTANTAGSGWTTLFNLPVTPMSWCSATLITTEGAVAMGRVSTSGKFDVYAPTANTTYWGEIVFFV